MLRLLIVDDEEIIRDAISHMADYRMLGYEVIATARNGMEAWDIISDEYLDVVITDIKMPILGGLDLIAKAFHAHMDLDFILLSGYGEFQFAKQAMQYGVRHYLLKPTDSDELIGALTTIREERKKQREMQEAQRQELLSRFYFHMQVSFLAESLHQDFSKVYDKYQPLLSLPPSWRTACICSYLEEQHLESFRKDIHHLLSRYSIVLHFPILYVQANAVLVFDIPSLNLQEELRRQIEGLRYPGQAVSLALQYLHFPSTAELFSELIRKVTRYDHILVEDGDGNSYEIQNSSTSLKKIEELGNAIGSASGDEELDEILAAALKDSSMDLAAAKHMVLNLYLWLISKEELSSPTIASDFYEKTADCASTQELYLLMRIAVKQMPSSSASHKASNIGLLKAYVEKHLNEENLSLKWISENYLFVNVKHLSKQFVKEEGQRFSEYLNSLRMERAKNLMSSYHNDNIKNIAEQVGFGNNPQYFSQVFKKYVGCTPRDFLDFSR